VVCGTGRKNQLEARNCRGDEQGEEEFGGGCEGQTKEVRFVGVANREPLCHLSRGAES
jgi:hypothetical protein